MAWHELREAATQNQPASTRPPPVPRPAQRPTQQRQTPVAPPPPAKAPVQAAPATEPAVVSSVADQVPVSPILQSLRQLRRDPAALRRAIGMTEVLGPPKALQG